MTSSHAANTPCGWAAATVRQLAAASTARTGTGQRRCAGTSPSTCAAEATTSGSRVRESSSGSSSPKLISASGKAGAIPASAPTRNTPSGPAAVAVRSSAIRPSGHSTQPTSSITTFVTSTISWPESCTARLTVWCHSAG